MSLMARSSTTTDPSPSSPRPARLIKGEPPVLHFLARAVFSACVYRNSNQILSIAAFVAVTLVGGQRPSSADQQDKTTTITAAIKFHQRNVTHDWQGEVLEYYKFTISKPNFLQVERRSESTDRFQLGTSVAHVLGQAFAWRTYQSRELTAVWRVRGPDEIEYFSRVSEFLAHRALYRTWEQMLCPYDILAKSRRDGLQIPHA